MNEEHQVPQVFHVLREDAPLAPDDRSALISQATRTDAMVEVVGQSEPLARLGGVGALLRYRW